MIQGMFLLSRIWVKILFDSSASHSFVVASSVNVLGRGGDLGRVVSCEFSSRD